MISLSFMMRLISAMSSELTHTVSHQATLTHIAHRLSPTFLPYQRVIPVIRIICIACGCASSISEGPKVEFCDESVTCSTFILHQCGLLSNREIHAQIAQSVLSCTKENQQLQDLGHILSLLISNVERFVGGRHLNNET